MVQADVLLILWLTHQQALWVGQESPVDEPQAHVIAVDACLADTRAHWPAAFLIIITEAATMLFLCGAWRDAGDYISDLQHDISELWGYVLQVFFDESFG